MIDMRIKHMFFDRPRIVAALDRTKRKALSRGGAFIRQAAKTSIRKRKGSAPAGKPPHSHEGSLRRLILFGYDQRTDSVVVGAVGFKKSTAPNVLEFGGPAVITRRVKGRLVGQRVKIAARPYMGPALQKEKAKLPKAWANSIRGGS